MTYGSGFNWKRRMHEWFVTMNIRCNRYYNAYRGIKILPVMLDRIKGSPGFATGLRLADSDLVRVKDVVKRHMAEQLNRAAPDQVDRLLSTPLEYYHTIAHLFPHGELLTRTARILPQWAVDEIRTTSLIRRLESEVGPFEISDEEKSGRESISIRVVRPGMENDVGSLHADEWFWDLYKFELPERRQRIKVWTAICCEPGKSGLLLSPESHARKWKYSTLTRVGMLKPLLDREESPPLELFNSNPGDAVAFNYKLLHGGAVTRGTTTRVSMEFTILVPDSIYFARQADRVS
jgi:hypothetical protein